MIKFILISIIPQTLPPTVLGHLHTSHEVASPPPVLLSYVLGNVAIQTWDQRPSERHMCHFLFSDPIKEEMEAACVTMCTLENAKNMHTHTYTWAYLSVWKTGMQRFSRLQQMATMPWAKSKSGQQTDNCCQSREGWEAKYQISFIYVYWQNMRQKLYLLHIER